MTAELYISEVQQQLTLFVFQFSLYCDFTERSLEEKEGLLLKNFLLLQAPPSQALNGVFVFVFLVK